MPSNNPAIPGDNRSDRTRFLDDIASLVRMASIAQGMMEDAFAYDRAVKNQGGVLTFMFAEEAIENLHFMIGDIQDRAASLAVRRHEIIGEGE